MGADGVGRPPLKLGVEHPTHSAHGSFIFTQSTPRYTPTTQRGHVPQVRWGPCGPLRPRRRQQECVLPVDRGACLRAMRGTMEAGRGVISLIESPPAPHLTHSPAFALPYTRIDAPHQPKPSGPVTPYKKVQQIKMCAWYPQVRRSPRRWVPEGDSTSQVSSRSLAHPSIRHAHTTHISTCTPTRATAPSPSPSTPASALRYVSIHEACRLFATPGAYPHTQPSSCHSHPTTRASRWG